MVAVVSGCVGPGPNVAALRAIKTEADQRLAQLKAQADGLTRPDASTEASVDAVVEQTPLPPVDPEEKAEATRLRADIAATRSRITQLEQVIADVQKIDARRRDVEAKLQRLEELRDKRDRSQPAPAPSFEDAPAPR